MVKCTKTEYFSHGGSNFANDFPSRQACQNAVNHVLNSKFIFFFELIKFYAFLLKNNGIIRNDIEGFFLFYRVVRVIPH